MLISIRMISLEKCVLCMKTVAMVLGNETKEFGGGKEDHMWSLTFDVSRFLTSQWC